MEEEKGKKVYKVVMLVILTAFITFMITSLSLYTYYSNNLDAISAKGIFSNLGNSSNNANISKYINKIRSLIDEYYLWDEEIDENKLESGAIAGYVEALGDKYTEYISKEEMEEFTEEITGTFVGIGIYMVADEDIGIIVYYPIPDSPAEEAGIKAGDIIKKVDGIEYGYEDFDTIADNIKGEAGTKVKLVIDRDGKELEFEITREKVNTSPVTTEILNNNIGYMNIPSFDSGTAESFKTKLEKLIEDGAKSLIIDLRNNGGGIVDESTEIADYLLDKGLRIMTTKDNKDKEEITISENKKIFDLPIIVLSNENTASASEILIGALKDNKRATIIGTKTYGKGIIQSVITLSDGSGLKITTAEYYTPNRTAIHKIGIEPDIEVKLPETVTNIYSVTKDNDTQLQRAVKELEK